MGAQVSRIARLCLIYHGEVVLTIEISEDDWEISLANEVVVYQAPTKTPVAIEEWMDMFEI